MSDLLTIRELISVGADPDPAILTPDGSVMTYAELREQMHTLVDQLRALGVTPTDRIALVAPNGPTMAIAYLASAVSACVAPLNPKYTETEYKFYLDDLNAKVLLFAGDASEALAAANDDVIAARLVGEPGNLSIETESQAAPTPDADPDSEDIGMVLHTSGTTSRPKIVPLRQRNLARSAQNIARALELGSSDRSMNVMPLFHIHGLMGGLLAPLSVGGSVACTDGFDAFKFFGQLEALKPTYYTAVPTMHQMVIARSKKHTETAAAAGLRFVRSSSASLPAVVLEQLETLFKAPVIEAYGMTEATHQMCGNTLPPGIRKVGSVGPPTGIELAILNDENNSLPVGERGEVSIKGDTVVDGYENNPDANASSFTAGWFRTGDEGYLDEDGFLFLTGRLKEQINRGGEKISPIEVDEALLRHDRIAQAVTFAVPHEKLGEEVAAGVVLEAGAELTEREVKDFLNETLAAFKVPRTVLFLEELPKGATGKLQRIGLAERLGLTS